MLTGSDNNLWILFHDFSTNEDESCFNIHFFPLAKKFVKMEFGIRWRTAEQIIRRDLTLNSISQSGFVIFYSCW